MRRRGIVMDLTVDSAVVLSADGEFCRLPRTADMSVGSEISWESPEVAATSGTSTRRFGFPLWYRVGIAGAAACLAIAAGAWWSVSVEHPVEAYARVSIDINPSVMMTVNSHMVVIDATGINSDGQRLVSQLKLKGEPLKRAVTDVLSAAEQDGMLPDADTILISAAPAQSNAAVDQTVEKIKTQAEQDVQSAIHSNPQVQKHHPKVYALGMSSMLWNAANQANISPGKLALYLIASGEGQSVSLGQLHGEKVGSILSNSKSKAAMQVLDANDASQVEHWLKQLPISISPVFTSDAARSQGNVQNQPVSNHQPATGIAPGQRGTSQQTDDGHQDGGGHPSNSPGKGKGNGKGNANSQTAGDTENSVTVRLGNSVITVPLGVPQLPGVTSQAHEQAGGWKNHKQDDHHKSDSGKPSNDIRADSNKETSDSLFPVGTSSAGSSKKQEKEKKDGGADDSKNGSLLGKLLGILGHH